MALFKRKNKDEEEYDEELEEEIEEEEEEEEEEELKERNVLSEEDKKSLREKIQGKKVDLDSDEQLQALEAYKINEIEEALKKKDEGKEKSEFFHRLTRNVPFLNLVLYYLMFVLVNSMYLVFITDNLVLAILTSLVASIFLVKSFVLKGAETKRYMNNIYQVSQYTTTIVNHLKSGNSFKNAYEETAKSVGGDVKYDVLRTLRQLEKNAELDTESFESYDLKNLTVFHRILDILFVEGSTQVGKMFESILGAIMKDVDKKNKLIEMKKTKAMTLYLMAGIAGFVPLLIANTMGANYALFLSNFVAPYFLAIYNLVLVYTLVKVNNSVNDVNLN